MANQTADRDYKRQPGASIAYKQAAVDLWVGELVSKNAAGFAKKSSDTAGEKFVGVQRIRSLNSTGSAGAVDSIVWNTGVMEFASSTNLTQANTGDKVYAIDSQTVATSSTNSILVGRITEVVSANVCRVAITPGV